MNFFALYFKYPTIAIIAALSVVYSILGKNNLNFFNSLFADSRILEFAETPPPKTIFFIPVFLLACMILSTNILVIVSCKF